MFNGIAAGTIAVVACAVIGSVTVLPAVLERLGPRIDRRPRRELLGRDRRPCPPPTGAGRDAVVRPIVRQTREALALAPAELRELTHGILPPMLTERGLPAALEELARGAALPTHLDAEVDRRLSDQVESAAYFVAGEALANAAKHSHSPMS